MSMPLHTTVATPAPSLAGHRIAVPYDTALELLALSLEQRGATLLRCPLSESVETTDTRPVREWLREFVDHPPQHLILSSADGLRGLVATALAMGLLGPFSEALAQVPRIGGPVEVGEALAELGLAGAWSAGRGRARDADRIGRGTSVAVQVSGTREDWALVERLVSSGVTLRAVLPRVPAPATDVLQGHALLEAIELGGVDALVLSRAAQWRRLTALARDAGRQRALLDGLRQSTVAVTRAALAEELLAAGVGTNILWIEGRFTTPVVDELAAHVAAARRHAPAKPERAPGP